MVGENGSPETPDWDIAATLTARIAADDGTRHDLDDVIRALGFTRADLELPERFELGEN